jgi:hypothetical protein
MLKKTIAYVDFDGKPQTEDAYFNLSKTELIKTELTGEGGSFKEQLETIIASNDPKVIINAFELVLEKAYGVRSEDGKRFVKSPELFEEFSQTAAYDALFTELATDAEAAATFINGVVPADLREADGKSASEIARERSQAALQGHKPKQKAEDKTVQQVPELPTVAPELESELEKRGGAEISEEDLNSLSIEELRARLIKQQ